MNCEFEHKIFNISDNGFEELALSIFRFQYKSNPVYHDYVNALRIDPEKTNSLEAIPFLPISFFKTHRVVTGNFEADTVFESSGTTGSINSRHYVKDANIYNESFLKAFEKAYGKAEDWCIIGLLPSYLERKASSLVWMVNELIRKSGNELSGFYLYEHDRLKSVLMALEEKAQKTLLIGVSFGLLDFAESHKMPLKNVMVMETGGMKGRRQEITRQELHGMLKNAWELTTIHSEYGMTELLSQAYSAENGVFHCPSWMQVLIRDEDDPLTVRSEGAGIINVIDLANIYSCAFIATDDIGRVYKDGSFEVQGRMDNSDVRGCSLMVAE
jgi:hypothetical protein